MLIMLFRLQIFLRGEKKIKIYIFLFLHLKITRLFGLKYKDCNFLHQSKPTKLQLKGNTERKF